SSERWRGRSEAGGNQFLQRGLAVAAGEANHFGRHPHTPVRGQRTEGAPRVVHPDNRQVSVQGIASDSAGRPCGRSPADEFLAVIVRAAQREEQLAGGKGARIGADAVELSVIALQGSAE